MFICGESGVGKEVVARMIHMRSTRRNQPFVKVNCAALPGELLESELFGYEQGAFTGAVRSKPGKFELANKGTIFLDEIAEMSPHLQAKLLHVLQDHQYSRLGGRHMVDVDVRVLAATNVEVQEAMKSGRLREDLYYRLERAFHQRAAAAGADHGNPAAVPAFPNKYSEKFQKEAPVPSEHLMEAAMRYRGRAICASWRISSSATSFWKMTKEASANWSKWPRPGSALRRARSPAPVREQGLKALVRGLKDEAEMEAIADALEKTHWCRKDAAQDAGHQLQGAALQDSAVQSGCGRGSRAAKTATETAPVAPEV